MKEKVYKNRREQFLKRMKPQSVAVLFAALPKVRSHDTEHPYRQDSDFYYLTGFKEDKAALVFVKDKKECKTILFVQKKDETLELWTGKRLGKDEAKKRFLVDKIFTKDTFSEKLKKYLIDKKRVYIDISTCDERNIQVKKLADDVKNDRTAKIAPNEFLHVKAIAQSMRLIKAQEEIELIRKALEITKEAHHKVMRMKKAGLFEYELQAEYEYEFKRRGAYSDAYTTIIASGNNGNTLHYIENSVKMKKGELILIDAGCEYEMYASDITRTIPASGKFTKAQKEVYETVLDVQLQVIDAIKPGVNKNDLQKMARELLCKGLVKLGVLKGDIQELLKDGKDKIYFPHGIGHWMGIDVHDECPYKDTEGNEIPLKEGMVLTIEPGLYLREDDENVPKKYRGIAIRIEDDILITADGYENLSQDIAKTVEEIESLYDS